MAASLHLQNRLLDHVFRNTAYTSPTSVYVGLALGDPANAGTEVSGGGYARAAVTFGSPSSGSVTNTGTVQFPTATLAWGEIDHFGIYDAETGGNLLSSGPLTEIEAPAGRTPRFAPGDLEVRVR